VDEVDGNSQDPREQQANAFAGEFLAPDEALRAWMDAHGQPLLNVMQLVKVANWFGISAPAALVRLSQAGILENPKQKRDLQSLLNGGAHRRAERAMELETWEDALAKIKRDKQVPRVPGRLRDNALTAYAAGLIDLGRLAGALRKSEGQAQQLVQQLGIEPSTPEPDW
jgi:hypothetical protein